MAAPGAPPTRLIVCVDGGSSGNGQSSIQRIFAGVKRGPCLDSSSGTTYNQVARYVAGIGSVDDAVSKGKLQATVLGHGYLKQVQDVYESCCQLVGDQDEIFLLGHGRGAWIVRAVAGLLHNLGALGSAGQPEFHREFKKALAEAEGRSSQYSGLSLSPMSTLSSIHGKKGLAIRFVGVFDTVKALGDTRFDITFNGSIQNMRSAVALNENRRFLSPELVMPEGLYGTTLQQSSRSFLQAYFIGDHADLGGTAKHGGLSLYPLQWMLQEALTCGLALEFDDRSIKSALLSILLPSLRGPSASWNCSTANGIRTVMPDIRLLHQESEWTVKLDVQRGALSAKQDREPFVKGVLQGYVDWAPQGTFVHPSVYLLLDELLPRMDTRQQLKLERHLQHWRERMLGSLNGITNTGFWSDTDADDEEADLGAVRVLVCGNTGVGKSTLINNVFGVEVTQAQDRTRGIHDVNEEIVFTGRPDLIVHDSRGFEAGAEAELQTMREFLERKSASSDVRERLHIIWFCVDVNSPRILQKATEELFLACSQYASDVPIVVVATKTDNYLDIESAKFRRACKKAGQRLEEDACDEHAAAQLLARIETIRTEMQSVEGGRLDACLAVSQDDPNSIAQLSTTTSNCFDTDKVRLLFVRAQITTIDLKVDMALKEILRRYKRLIRAATGSAFAPIGNTIAQRVSTTAITKSIINCFGLPSVSADVALATLKANVWKSQNINMTLALAEGLQLIGLVGTVFVTGIPVFLVTGAINAAYIVPATCRLFLMMACDLTFVLARSFKEVTFRANGQPTERDVEQAARNYRIRGYAHHVHLAIKTLVPRKSIKKAFKADDVEEGIETIFATYKEKLMEDVDLPLTVDGLTIESEHDEDNSTDAGSVLHRDIKEAASHLAELEGSTPLVEMDAEKSPVELDATGQIVELPGDEPDYKQKLARKWTLKRFQQKGS